MKIVFLLVIRHLVKWFVMHRCANSCFSHHLNKFISFNYKIGQRSQDLDPLYYENGLLYIVKSSVILNNEIITNESLPFQVNHPFANVDIDTQDDFEYAEYLLQKFNNH